MNINIYLLCSIIRIYCLLLLHVDVFLLSLLFVAATGDTKRCQEANKVAMAFTSA